MASACHPPSATRTISDATNSSLMCNCSNSSVVSCAKYVAFVGVFTNSLLFFSTSDFSSSSFALSPPRPKVSWLFHPQLKSSLLFVNTHEFLDPAINRSISSNSFLSSSFSSGSSFFSSLSVMSNGNTISVG